MGAQMCSPQSKLDNSTFYQNSQIQVVQQCDNPSKQHLSSQFLQTTILASWNMLEQKNIIPSLKKQALNQSSQTQINCSKNKQETSKSNQESNQKYEKQQFFNYFKYLKPHRPSLKENYQQAQINLSDFISLRNQNIQDFYKFDVKIGEGSFGNVYKCFDKKSKEERAVKVLKKAGMSNTTKMGFIAQIDLFKTLDHPNIVKLYDIFFYSDHYYVITEFCAGGTLQNILNKFASSIDQKFIKSIMRQLISVISYINSLNIVHRDLKLDNIVLSNQLNQNNLLENNSIKIIDFGTATKMEMHRKNKTGLVGTVYYMAPQFTKGYYNEKCDIWSAGVIMFLLLFKKYPFKGKNEKQILNAATETEINWKQINQRTKYSESVIQLLDSMLQKNYFKRPTPISILRSVWIQSQQKMRLSKQIKEQTLNKLDNYKRQNNFICLVQSFLIFKKTTQTQRQQISKIFCEIDKDNSGLIQVKQLVEFYRNNMKDSSIEQVKQIINKIDKNKSGKIDLNQFMGLIVDRKKIFMRETLKDAFDYIDKKGTGYIQKKQLKTVLKGSKKKQIQEIFLMIDLNQDNKIQFQQFADYLISLN